MEGAADEEHRLTHTPGPPPPRGSWMQRGVVAAGFDWSSDPTGRGCWEFAADLLGYSISTYVDAPITAPNGPQWVHIK